MSNGLPLRFMWAMLAITIHQKHGATHMSDATTARGMAPRDQLTLALERTYLAYERTLMAWIRTAASLIAFGFTLYKFFFFMHEQEPGRQIDQLLGPRTYGLIMMGIGVITLLLAAWQHRRQMHELRAQYPQAPPSLSLVLAALIAGLGVLGFIAAILRQ
jgi:putative membrane protein